LADIKYRQLQPVLDTPSNPKTLRNFLVETGQETDLIELIEAREMTLATSGSFASHRVYMTISSRYYFGSRMQTPFLLGGSLSLHLCLL
jgi:hypothetical protein